MQNFRYSHVTGKKEFEDDMTKFNPEAVLKSRLADLGTRIADIDTILQQPLSADFEEQAGDLEGQESLEAVEGAARREVKSIQAALQRIAKGNYGICIDCGEPIPEKRLESVPTALRCMPCETKRSAK